MRAERHELDMGKLWLIAPLLPVVGLLRSPSANKSSTPLEIFFRSSRMESCSLSFPMILDERLCACVSSVVSAVVSDDKTFERLVCVDIDDCSKALESSSACTLRARSESR